MSVHWRGREVHTEVLGDGPPVVMCHGTPWSSWLWRPYAEALAGRYRVHLWDMPGYGRSSKHVGHDVGLDLQGELLVDLLERWGLERPHVIAHDIGGAVALRAHLLHGAAYSSLALVDVVALDPWGSGFFRLVREHDEVFAQQPAAVHAGAVAAYVGGASHRGLRPDDLTALIEPWTTQEGRAAFYRQIAQADPAHTRAFTDDLGRIDLPVRVLWGADDAWIDVEQAHRLTEQIPGASLRVIPDAGHLVHLDAPVVLATELATWLAQVADG